MLISSHHNPSVVSLVWDITSETDSRHIALSWPSKNQICFFPKNMSWRPQHSASSHSHTCSRQHSPESRPKVTPACEHECGSLFWKVNIAVATQKRLQLEEFTANSHDVRIHCWGNRLVFSYRVFIWFVTAIINKHFPALWWIDCEALSIQVLLWKAPSLWWKQWGSTNVYVWHRDRTLFMRWRLVAFGS